MYRFHGTGDTSVPGQNVFVLPMRSAAPDFSVAPFWRGGMLFDTTSNHVLISRTGSTTFAKMDIQGDTTTHAQNKLTDSTGLILKAANGKYYKIKISATGTITADSTGQN